MTIPRDHSKLDAKIIEAIKTGNTQFWALIAYIKPDNERLIDRRLQVMRENGLISFKHKGGWRINEVTP